MIRKYQDQAVKTIENMSNTLKASMTCTVERYIEDVSTAKRNLEADAIFLRRLCTSIDTLRQSRRSGFTSLASTGWGNAFRF